MADSLKVFANQLAEPVAPTVGAHSIPLFTTEAGTSVVVKDLKFRYAVGSPYKRPATLALDGFPLHAATDAGGFDAAGSLIMGESSTLSLEVEAEAQVKNFGKLQGLIEASDGKLVYIENDYVEMVLTDFDVEALYGRIVDAAKPTGVTPEDSYSTATFVRNGVLHFCYSTGTSVVMLGKDGQPLGTFGFGDTVYAICSDDTYIYGISSTSRPLIFRYNHQTNAMAANLTTSTTIRGYGNSNKGFIAYYNGFIYTKASGSDTDVQIVNTSSGAVTTKPALSETEYIGGAITVAKDGVAWLLNFGDALAEAIRISNWSRTSFFTGLSPATTKSNQALCIGPGLVLFNDGSYNRSCIVDINSGTPVLTRVESTFNLGNQASVLVAAPLFAPATDFPRSLDYNLLLAGVETA